MKSDKKEDPHRFTRHIIAVRGDTHAGQDDGLKNPATLIPAVDEKGNRQEDVFTPVSLRPFQKKLWQWHEDARGEIAKLARKDPIYFLEMGDITEGGVFKDNVGEYKMSDQYFIAKASFEPWLEMPQVKRVYIVKGTSVHTFGSGSSELIIADALRSKYPDKVIKCADHWMFNIGGCWLDVAHHGPFYGKRIWLEGNELHWYIQDVLMKDVSDGDQPPDVILRGHFHTFKQGWGWHQNSHNFWQCKGIITPALSFITDHSKKSTASKSKISVGMIALEVIDGKLHDVHPFVHWIDLRTMEIVK